MVIDPYRTRTAKRAPTGILPINPGTDAALALGMMHVIINESFARRRLRGEVHARDSSSCARKCRTIRRNESRDGRESPQQTFAKLAREYATCRPAAIRVNYGVQRSQNGGMAMRAIAMLPCITGSWKEVGGGLAALHQRRVGTERRMPWNVPT